MAARVAAAAFQSGGLERLRFDGGAGRAASRLRLDRGRKFPPDDLRAVEFPPDVLRAVDDRQPALLVVALAGGRCVVPVRASFNALSRAMSSYSSRLAPS